MITPPSPNADLPAGLPVAVIGGGPVGLAAAAHLLARGLTPKVYEAGDGVGAYVQAWGHVRLFSPWRYCVDGAAQAMLDAAGWTPPPPDELPTGRDLVERYLVPLAAIPAMASVIETGARVTAVTREGMDKVRTEGRAEAPFALHVRDRTGRVRVDHARAVIDASGTWGQPNPLGASGVPVPGEAEHAARIAYGIPDVLGAERDSYAGRRVLVIGSGHSAANALLELARLAEDAPATEILWAVRGSNLARLFGGGRADQLPARGELGAALRRLADSGRLEIHRSFHTAAVEAEGGALLVAGLTPEGARTIGPVDRIVAATGQRPDLGLLRELRLDLDPWLESTAALGPLIDPNVHSCGTVPPHGHRELRHHEPDFYTAGVKSYGRAPTFLLVTGYEQVRSIAAALAGDLAAADTVELVLPETGVCGTDAPEDVAAPCCGASAETADPEIVAVQAEAAAESCCDRNVCCDGAYSSTAAAPRPAANTGCCG